MPPTGRTPGDRIEAPGSVDGLARPGNDGGDPGSGVGVEHDYRVPDVESAAQQILQGGRGNQPSVDLGAVHSLPVVLASSQRSTGRSPAWRSDSVMLSM
jgi:hypothetical protein